MKYLYKYFLSDCRKGWICKRPLKVEYLTPLIANLDKIINYPKKRVLIRIFFYLIPGISIMT